MLIVCCTCVLQVVCHLWTADGMGQERKRDNMLEQIEIQAGRVICPCMLDRKACQTVSVACCLRLCMRPSLTDFAHGDILS